MNRFFPYFCAEKPKHREKEILNHYHRGFDHCRSAFRRERACRNPQRKASCLEEQLASRIPSNVADKGQNHKQLRLSAPKDGGHYERVQRAFATPLFSQKQEYTLDLCFALEKVKNEFEEFTKDKTPYDRIMINLDIEIDRYARLVESLRRLPPEIAKVKNLPDSLAFYNDTLHQHLKLNRDNRIDLLAEAQNTTDSIARVFVLDKKGERDRDTCLYFATELLKMYAESRTVIMADSIHYDEVYLRLKESYDYAQKYYKLLQTRIFIEGQTPWPVILSDPKQYWNEAVKDIKNKYVLYEDTFASQDSLTVAIAPKVTDSLSIADVLPIPLSEEDSTLTASTDTTSTIADPLDKVEEVRSLDEADWEYLALLLVIVFMLVGLMFAWLIATLVLLPIFLFVKPVKKAVAKQQRRYLTLLAGILLFVIFNNSSNFVENDLYEKAIRLTNTFMWLLAAIIAALLIRLKPEQLKNSVRLYLPTILMAIGVIGCRSIFLPNTMLNFLFPPLLIVFFIWQLLACLKHGKLAEKSDRIMGRASLSATGLALLLAVAGYIFAALLILVWWYFQLAAIHTMTTIWHLISRYKEKRMKLRLDHYRGCCGWSWKWCFPCLRCCRCRSVSISALTSSISTTSTIPYTTSLSFFSPIRKALKRSGFPSMASSFCHASCSFSAMRTKPSTTSGGKAVIPRFSAKTTARASARTKSTSRWATALSA